MWSLERDWSTLVRVAEFLGLPGGATRTTKKIVALCHSLLSERGEVSGSRLASEALDAYRALDDARGAAFFESLIREFSPDPEEVGRRATRTAATPRPRISRAAKSGGAASPGAVPPAEPGAQWHAHSGGDAEPGVAGVHRNARLKPIAADLAHLFTSWFNRGFPGAAPHRLATSADSRKADPV
jgi:malonyl-CoA decarboxylase